MTAKSTACRTCSRDATSGGAVIEIYVIGHEGEMRPPILHAEMAHKITGVLDRQDRIIVIMSPQSVDQSQNGNHGLPW